MPKKLIRFGAVAFALAFCASASAQADSQWRWATQIQRTYEVGGELNGTYQQGSIAEQTVSFAWSQPAGPNYWIYEISGTVVEPTYTWDGTPFTGDARPNHFNFNGGFGNQSSGTGPGFGWGTTLNWNRQNLFGYTSPELPVAQMTSYNAATGEFYFGFVWRIAASYGTNRWPSNEMAVHARFLTYSGPLGFDGVTYLTRGSVTVTAARVGISNDPYVLGAIPGPASILPFGIALLSQGRRRSRGSHSSW